MTALKQVQKVVDVFSLSKQDCDGFVEHVLALGTLDGLKSLPILVDLLKIESNILLLCLNFIAYYSSALSQEI